MTFNSEAIIKLIHELLDHIIDFFNSQKGSGSVYDDAIEQVCPQLELLQSSLKTEPTEWLVCLVAYLGISFYRFQEIIRQ